MKNNFSFKLDDLTSIGTHTVILGTTENDLFSGWVKNDKCTIKIVPIHSSSLKLRDTSIFEVVDGKVTEKEIGTVFVECKDAEKAIA